MGITEMLLIAAALIIGALAGYLYGRGKAPVAAPQGDTVSRADYDAAVQDSTELSVQLKRAQQDIDAQKEHIGQLQHENKTLTAHIATLEARRQVLEQQLTDHQQQLRAQFSEMANGIIEQMGKRFNTQSEEKIGNLLTPLQTRLNDFQKLVTESFGQQGKEQFALKEQIAAIVKTNNDMRLQTESLVSALRSDSKAQGNWGEVMLERILEASQLRRGEDYYPQSTGLDLKDEDGNILRPDFVVRLPGDKHIIIDSKVSLTSYERLFSERDETVKAVHLKAFLDSVRRHVSQLSEKGYQQLENLGTPDFVLMFMPVEGAYALAIQQDNTLHSYAWDKRIVLVCPTTLFATLRTVESLWRIERQNRNTQEIARIGGKLHDQLTGFISDMEAIHEQLNRMGKVYDHAVGRLYKGRDNIIGNAKKLQDLGAKTKKELQPALAGYALDEDEAEVPEALAS